RQYLGDDGVLAAIEDKVRRDGSDFWFADPGKPVTPASWDFLPKETRCRGKDCGKQVFDRETDILDVWMDSGASWLRVLKPAGDYPCDLYLEGSDQHR